MNAVGCSTGSSEPTRARPRAAPPTVPSATRPARGRRGCSSRRFLDRNLLPLPSQHHSTGLASPERYDKRYEAHFLSPGKVTPDIHLLRRQAMYACVPENGCGFFEGVCTPSNATAHSCDPPPPRNTKEPEPH